MIFASEANRDGIDVKAGDHHRRRFFMMGLSIRKGILLDAIPES